jgi:putative endonuclease
VVEVNGQPAPVGRFAALLIELERRALLGLDRLARRRGLRRRKLPAHLVAGERGELEALFFLRSQGFTVVERRWRTPESRGDLDLIAWEGETLCFVEVKTRTARDQTPAALAVDRDKRRMLREMGRAYLRTLPRAQRSTVLRRFDIVSVYLLEDGAACELLRGVTVDSNDGPR